MPKMFAELVQAMSQGDADILGDLHQGAISYGESGQFFSPESLSHLMARLTVDPNTESDNDRLLISDPCCGSGRMLLSASEIHPAATLVGQDVDARCAKITSLNLSLRGKYGWVVCGNALTGETQFAYRIGSFFHETEHGPRRGVIRDVPPESTPVPVIAQRVRHDAGELFAGQQETEPVAETTLPTIIEVPRWLARLEPQRAALDGESREQHQGDPRCPSKKVQATPNVEVIAKDEPPPKQQQLF